MRVYGPRISLANFAPCCSSFPSYRLSMALPSNRDEPRNNACQTAYLVLVPVSHLITYLPRDIDPFEVHRRRKAGPRRIASDVRCLKNKRPIFVAATIYTLHANCDVMSIASHERFGIELCVCAGNESICVLEIRPLDPWLRSLESYSAVWSE